MPGNGDETGWLGQSSGPSPNNHHSGNYDDQVRRGSGRKSVIISRNDGLSSSSSMTNSNHKRKAGQLSESSSDDEQPAAKRKFETTNVIQPATYYNSHQLAESVGLPEQLRIDNKSQPARKWKRKQNLSSSSLKAPDDLTNNRNIKESITKKRKHDSVAETVEADLNKMAKFRSEEANVQESKVGRMMRNMGYTTGKGLGKDKQGIVEPIEPKSIIARSGLGFAAEGLERGKVNWDFDAEQIIVEEQVQWIPNSSGKALKLTFEELQEWRLIGGQELDLSKSKQFCEGEILDDVLSSKNVLDRMDEREFGRARFRSNPFETIGKGIFMNRAALKMANLDAILQFELTNPFVHEGLRFSDMTNELFYFADVCAGPGGFSEYVLWRKGWDAKGFGFTLKGDCDFKLSDFLAGTPESFEPHYGVHNDGNIFDPENIQSFIKYVKDSTDGFGVHLMMADGGFSVDGQENIQEILSKQLYLSQFVVALGILRKGGNFICKLFDIFTKFSVGLIYLLRTCFRQISVHKPATSRPANSERYVICKGREEDIDAVYRYLVDCHELMWNLSNDPKNKNPTKEVMELVSFDVIKNDQEFFDFIYNSNNDLGNRQIQNLKKIVAFYKDPTLIEKRQHETKLKCLQFWSVPNERRKGFPFIAPPASRFHELLRSDDGDFARRHETSLTLSNMKSIFRSPCDWFAVFVGGDKNRSKCGFYLGLGGTNIYRSMDGRWEPVETKFELCKDTLVYGEIVDEIYDVRKPMTSRRVAFHIIDGMILGGKDVRSCNYDERYQVCSQFAKAMNKQSIPSFAPVRVKTLVSMEHIGAILDGLQENLTGSKIYLPINFNEEQSQRQQLLVGGVLFIKISNEPWMIARSRREQKLYYFNTRFKNSTYEPTPDVYADFKHTMDNRVIWWWDNYTIFGQNDEAALNSANDVSERVHVQPFLKFTQSIPL